MTDDDIADMLIRGLALALAVQRKNALEHPVRTSAVGLAIEYEKYIRDGADG